MILFVLLLAQGIIAPSRQDCLTISHNHDGENDTDQVCKRYKASTSHTENLHFADTSEYTFSFDCSWKGRRYPFRLLCDKAGDAPFEDTVDDHDVGFCSGTIGCSSGSAENNEMCQDPSLATSDYTGVNTEAVTVSLSFM
ncbi:hypothetical protein MRB53_039612 [Persea americana]|nr:hypothetical protein MRB53_039612 [Persea americana]